MTDGDKLAKVKAEIESRLKEVTDRIKELGNNESHRIGLFDLKDVYEELLSFIDTTQKEAKNEVEQIMAEIDAKFPKFAKERMYSKDNYTDKDRKVLCDGCEEECKFKPIASVWHDAKAEEPKFERWILMADDHGHYMAGLWQNDGKGFEGIGEIHIGPLKFNLPLGLEGDIVRWCYISDIDKNEKGGYCD